MSVLIWIQTVWHSDSVPAFANSLDPDQDRQIVGPELDSNHLNSCSWNNFLYMFETNGNHDF